MDEAEKVEVLTKRLGRVDVGASERRRAERRRSRRRRKAELCCREAEAARSRRATERMPRAIGLLRRRGQDSRARGLEETFPEARARIWRSHGYLAGTSSALSCRVCATVAQRDDTERRGDAERREKEERRTAHERRTRTTRRSSHRPSPQREPRGPATARWRRRTSPGTRQP